MLISSGTQKKQTAMTRDKLIEQESEKYADELIKCSAIGQHDKTWMSEVYKQTINSQLVKGFIELAVIEARIEENIFSFRDSENFDYAYYNKRNNELSIQRTELLKRLNLEG